MITSTVNPSTFVAFNDSTAFVHCIQISKKIYNHNENTLRNRRAHVPFLSVPSPKGIWALYFLFSAAMSNRLLPPSRHFLFSTVCQRPFPEVSRGDLDHFRFSVPMNTPVLRSQYRITPPILQTRTLPLPIPTKVAVPQVTPPLPPLEIALATCPQRRRSVPPLRLSYPTGIPSPAVVRERRHPRGICKIAGCQKIVRSKRLCKAHGGGLRCQSPGCVNSDQGGGYCIGHGGGKRCTSEGCPNGAQSFGLCKAHGGGSSCAAVGCNRPRNGTPFCRQHGGRRLCRISGCQRVEHRAGLCSGHSNHIYCNASKCRRISRFNGYCALHASL